MIRCLSCMNTYEDKTDICPHCGYVQNTKPREAYHLIPGTILQGRYIVGKVLGYGGFGVTYVGFDYSLERKIAIKEFLPTTLATRLPGETKLTIYNNATTPQQYEAGLNRFVEEAQTLAQFNGVPGIVDIYDTFMHNNTAYIVMQFLKGQDVRKILGEQGAFDYEMARGIVLKVCDSLIPVHAQNIIHRDISPDNIYITETGEVKLLDFGAARYESAVNSKSLSVILKSGYAPEEQYRSKGEQGAWTDVYALAATFYKMLTGRTPPDSMDRAIKDEIEEPSKLGVQIPPSAENALMNALHVRKTDRTKSIEEFKQQLLADEVVRTKPKAIKKDSTKIPLAAKIIIGLCAVFLISFGLFAANGGFLSEDGTQETIVIGGTQLEDNFGTVEETLTIENDHVIEWRDPVFERHVRRIINKPEGDIMLSEIIYVTNLDLGSYALEDKAVVTDFSDIEYFENLTELSLDGNEITDISFLQNLTGLEKLNIDRNLIADLSPLSNMANLTQLLARNNLISDISPLSSCVNLFDVYMSNTYTQYEENTDMQNNTIADFSPLETCTDLYLLEIQNIPSLDLNSIAQLTQVNTIYASDCNIADVSPLENLVNLEHLDLDRNSVTDISALSKLENLKILEISYNEELEDLSSLQNLQNLENLSIRSTNVKDLSPLSNIASLQTLTLNMNEFEDLSAVEHVPAVSN